MSEKIKILVCDNDPHVGKVFKELDAKMNMAITCVNNGPVALEEAKKNNFYCTFLDSKMASDNQFNALKALKVQHPNLPIFIMVESAADPFLEKCLKEGARAAFYKPPDMDKLNSAIQTLEAQRFFQGELERAMAQLKAAPESHEAEAKVKKISGMVRETEEIEQARKKQEGVK